jgi:hypothetical protein
MLVEMHVSRVGALVVFSVELRVVKTSGIRSHYSIVDVLYNELIHVIPIPLFHPVTSLQVCV